MSELYCLQKGKGWNILMRGLFVYWCTNFKTELSTKDLGKSYDNENRALNISRTCKFVINYWWLVKWTQLQVLNGDPYNRKCDVYSFGICLWEIYCCDMPYPDLSFSEVTSAVVRQVCTSLQQSFVYSSIYYICIFLGAKYCLWITESKARNTKMLPKFIS